jgi:hypothetical protein
VRLRIEQNFQKIDIEGATLATLSGRDIAWHKNGKEFRGRVEGERMIGKLAGRPLELVRR